MQYPLNNKLMLYETRELQQAYAAQTGLPGNIQARKATDPFLFQHSKSAAIFIFEHCVRYYARVVHRVLSAVCVVVMERRI